MVGPILRQLPVYPPSQRWPAALESSGLLAFFLASKAPSSLSRHIDYHILDKTCISILRKISLANRRFLPPCDISQIKYAFNLELKLSS